MCEIDYNLNIRNIGKITFVYVIFFYIVNP